VVLALLAYGNSFTGAFVFDDLPAIRDNPSIRDWTAWREILSPPSYLTTSGRPVVNASLALSFAVSGTQPWAHHVLNFTVHLLAGLTLFGLARRTLLLPRLQARFGRDALPLALLVAAWWTLHPLQTEAVTYLVQRAESLMGLFYLLTLYGFIRAAEAPATRTWKVAAVVSCALGMGSKEVMVSAPFIVLLYDRTFVAGSFRAAWQARRGLYLGLAATWLLLALLVIGEGGNRGGSIGFGVAVGWWQHGLTQFSAITHYLALAVHPTPLVFEYEPEWNAGLTQTIPTALFVTTLLAIIGIGLRRGWAIGVLGAWFFVILAPTSLLPAPTQLIAEHRMYLALAPLAALVVLGLYAWTGRRGALVLALVPLAFVLLTARRNEDYRSEISLWTDTVAKRPRNPLAHASLGNALSRIGRFDEALPHCQEAVRLDPNNALLQYSLGLVYAQLGRSDEALAAYAEAIRLRPIYAEARNDYGVALVQAGRREDALREFTTAVQLLPNDAGAHYNLGAALLELGQARQSIQHFEAATKLRPNYPEAFVAWGTALAVTGHVTAAMENYQHAIALRPNEVNARNRAGLLLMAIDHVPEAIAYFEAALQINPADSATRANLEKARMLLLKAKPPDPENTDTAPY
jgi:tetratricopeptide (TPR) repeat protein